MGLRVMGKEGRKRMSLEIKELSFSYSFRAGKRDEKKILQDFSLTIERGERVGIVAPSGVGKTTLCKLIAGYLRPEKGEILLDGKMLKSYRGYCPVQMIWQQPELAVNPLLRMKDVLAEGDEVETQVLETLGIRPEWMERFPGELSGGELQRFCIARALGKRTQFLLADEISTMLDLITQSRIWHFLIEETERRNIGMLVVSHDPELLDCVCTRKVEMV